MDTRALAGLLERKPLPDLAAIAARHTGRVALVGGTIRDALLGRAPADIDIVVEQDLEGFLAAVEALRGRAPASIGDRFQDTHRMRWGGVQVDIARSLGTVEEDLARRDFSVNAMAVELPSGIDAVTILDPHGGLQDLDAGRIRQTLPGVLDRDPLRALRAVRYAVDLPGFEIEATTRDAVRDVAPGLSAVAAERRVGEWLAILALPGWVEGMELARELQVAAAALGALHGLGSARAWAAGERREPSPDGVGRLASLVLDLAADGRVEEVGERLQQQRWPRRLVRRSVRSARWAREPVEDPDALAGRALEDPDAATIAGELAVRLARAAGREAPEWPSRLEAFAERAREPRWVRGDDLLAAGYAQGPRLGEALRVSAIGQVRRRWRDRQAALAWVRARRSAETS